ncbi:MAG: Sensor histidine kinase TodS [Acidobacteria bacterium]|nr:Sensor histidine kinase TodS [Acidobacteriota bacterium]
MSRTKVLIAEDNLDSQQLLQMILENEGFIVTTASDGEKAIDILREIKPDVLVTDLLLPTVSGGDLIRHVRSTPELAQIPIVVISAYGDHYEADALAVGANVVLKKPLDSDFLISTIKELKASCGNATRAET